VNVDLTDYQMPRLNGLELLTLSQELMPEAPVILISGAHPSLEQVAIERGAFAWIRKPVPVTQVLLIVGAAMDRPDPAREMRERSPVQPRSRPRHWSQRLT
jgi:DNA-binding NtrC family response regulator